MVADRLCRIDQHGIACTVTKLVVNLLEMIEIDKSQRQGRLGTHRKRKLLLQQLLAAMARETAGHAVLRSFAHEHDHERKLGDPRQRRLACDK